MGFLIILFTFLGMEAVAWLTHKYIMHGVLWILHEDHHVKTKGHVHVEKNDSFFLIFAIPSILLFALFQFKHLHWALYIASGITLYGIAYFFVHDIFIHQRFKFFRLSDSIYLRAIRKAHKMHHKHLTRFNGESFGMLLVPFKYFREMRKAN
ncbi:MAG: beta-carotene hydroxylase [Saprospiraceae bacterium]